MRSYLAGFLFSLILSQQLGAQALTASSKQRTAIAHLIEAYSTARETRDTILLKRILTNNIDQLVSTGEWRSGLVAAVAGMLRSSATHPGTRTLTLDKIKMLTKNCVLADCRYTIQNETSGTQNMWSSFVVVRIKRTWKIAAIRNMLPTGQ